MKHKTEIKTYYYKNGNKWYEIPYVNDKRNGLQIVWHSNGNKSCETPYVNGKVHGLEIVYNKNGKNGMKLHTKTILLMGREYPLHIKK